MKKSIIAAGAASVALAAMPVVGAFATTTYYGSPIADTLTMNLAEVCTLTRKVTSGDAGHPAGSSTATNAGWTTGTGEGNDTVNGTNVKKTLHDTFAADIVAGTDYANIAQSAFNVTCNAANDGYQVSVVTTAFTGVDGANTWSYASSGKSSSASTWNLTSSAKTTTVEQTTTPTPLASGDNVWSSEAGTAVTSADFTITYNVYPHIDQQTGTYSAHAVYTLGDLNS